MRRSADDADRILALFLNFAKGEPLSSVIKSHQNACANIVHFVNNAGAKYDFRGSFGDEPNDLLLFMVNQNIITAEEAEELQQKQTIQAEILEGFISNGYKTSSKYSGKVATHEVTPKKNFEDAQKAKELAFQQIPEIETEAESLESQ